jgi:hypothetical protein
MKNKILSIVISLCFLFSGIVIVNAQDQNQEYQSITIIEEESNPSFNEDLSGLMLQVTESTVLAYISGLVGFGPRVTGTTACDNSGDYIAGVFAGFGLDSEVIPWSHGGYSANNIEGTLEGTNEESDRIYVICAHYDSVPGSPGADDNAAGTAAVMAAAKVMSQYTFSHTVKFVAFSGEEQGLHGSTVYAANAASNNWNIVEVLNGDMIGYTETPTGQTNIKVLGSGSISGTAQIICDTYPDLLDLTVVPGSASGNSDHWPFIQNGYDAAMFHEYEFNNYYHSPQDTIAHMDMDYDMRVTRLMLGTLSYYAGFVPQYNGGGIDLIPPVVTIETPVEQDYITDMVTVSGQAFDFTSFVKDVLVKLDDQDWEYADLENANGGKVIWEYSFDSSQFEDGPLRISAVALNKKGTQSGVFNIDVMITNTPLTGTVTIPSLGITLEEVSYSTSVSGGAPPYEYFWEFGDDSISELSEPSHIYYQPGEYTVTVTITDQLGQEIIRQSTILINPSDEIPPEVSITSPGNHIYFSNTKILPFFTPVIMQSVEINIDAVDFESGIDHVNIAVDGEHQTTLHHAPYTWMFEVEGFGQHEILVEGYDIVGNSDADAMMIWTLF